MWIINAFQVQRTLATAYVCSSWCTRTQRVASTVHTLIIGLWFEIFWCMNCDLFPPRVMCPQYDARVERSGVIAQCRQWVRATSLSWDTSGIVHTHFVSLPRRATLEEFRPSEKTWKVHTVTAAHERLRWQRSFRRSCARRRHLPGKQRLRHTAPDRRTYRTKTTKDFLSFVYQVEESMQGHTAHCRAEVMHKLTSHRIFCNLHCDGRWISKNLDKHTTLHDITWNYRVWKKNESRNAQLLHKKFVANCFLFFQYWNV